MNKRRTKFLQARIDEFLNRGTEDKPKGAHEAYIEREYQRDYDKWVKKVNEHLPDLSARVFSLRNKNSGSRELESLLGKVIHEIRNVHQFHVDLGDRTAHRIVVKILVEELFKDLNNAEK